MLVLAPFQKALNKNSCWSHDISHTAHNINSLPEVRRHSMVMLRVHAIIIILFYCLSANILTITKAANERNL